MNVRPQNFPSNCLDKTSIKIYNTTYSIFKQERLWVIFFYFNNKRKLASLYHFSCGQILWIMGKFELFGQVNGQIATLIWLLADKAYSMPQAKRYTESHFSRSKHPTWPYARPPTEPVAGQACNIQPCDCNSFSK